MGDRNHPQLKVEDKTSSPELKHEWPKFGPRVYRII